MEKKTLPTVPCPRCESSLVSQTVRTAIWQDDRVAIVEDIPGYVCNSCMEQFYDDDVSDALRRLTEESFPSAEADREISVPVFSLKTRL
jgi:YgiT-type zinc finger domain-containing protein